MSIESIGAYTDVWGSVVQSMRGNQDEKGSNPFEDMASNLISDKDTDGDSLLSADELGIEKDALAELDSDGDGLLSNSELADGIAKHSDVLSDLVNPATQFAQHILSQLDADGDGALSLDESGLGEDVYNELDTDGDGSLSSDEIAASAPSPPPPGGAEGAGDATSGLTSSTFSEIDTNGDGVISQAELQAWLAKSQTNLSEILSEDDSSSDDNQGFTGLFTQALDAYQSQMDSIMQNLFGTEGGAQALLDAGVYGQPLDLTV